MTYPRQSMSLLSRVLIGTLGPLALVGCTGALRDGFQVDQVVKHKTTISNWGKHEVQPIDLDKPYKYAEPSDTSRNAIEWARKSVAHRNALQDYIRSLSVKICSNHLASISGTQAGINVAGQAIIAALGAAGAVVTGGASQVISGASGATAGTLSAFNEHVFRKKLADAVVNQIRNDRTQAWAEIIENRNKGINATSTDAYTPEGAIADVKRYHDMCSLYHGLASLASIAGSKQGVGVSSKKKSTP